VIIEPEFKAEPFSHSLHFVVLLGLDFIPRHHKLAFALLFNELPSKRFISLKEQCTELVRSLKETPLQMM